MDLPRVRSTCASLRGEIELQGPGKTAVLTATMTTRMTLNWLVACGLWLLACDTWHVACST
eukprot:9432651-Lingulodinium_polyedra.AAC.1